MELVHKIRAMRELPPAQLVKLANERLPDLVAAVLTIVFAWYFAQLIWLLIQTEPEFDWNTRIVAPTVANMSIAPGADDRAIANAHLFGEANAEPEPLSTVDAPETRLNLKLRGSIAATDENIAHAIIADGNGKDKVYFIEDTVAGGAKLFEVHPDRVILKRAGTLETLRLPKKSLALGTLSAAPSNPSELSVPSELENLMSGNSSSFTEIIRPQPYMPNGELRGYRVYPGRNRRAFAALGLRPGDLVTDINGQALNNLQAGMEIFRNLGDSSQITVTIERNGSPMALTLDSSELNNAAGARQ